MLISYKHKIYTTLGTPTNLSGNVVSATNSAGVPSKDYAIKGKTIVWNQLLESPDFSSTTVDTRPYVDFMVLQVESPYEVFYKSELSEPGLVSAIFEITVSGSCRLKHNGSQYDIDFYYFNSVKGHKYYIYINFTSVNPTVVGGVSYNKAQIFDLTQMFGAGNEPATVSEFRAMFPDDYYPYNAGELKSIEPTSVEAKNQSGEKRFVNIPSSKYFPDGMRSAGSAYDEINFLSQKAIKRVGAVDLGTLNWNYDSTSPSHERFVASVDGIKLVSGSVKGNLVCPKYTTVSADDIYLHTTDKTIAAHNTIAQVWVYDTAYTDAVAFKAAMSGVMLYYELATPVETAITPPLQALSTFKGFTSFSAPNSLTQNGPMSVTYYAEGGANPESGWLTSYKRKLYMGRNIEWNQLLDKSKYPATQTVNGVTFTNNGDGTITANGTAIDRAVFFLYKRGEISVIRGKGLAIGDPEPGGAFINYDLYDSNGQWVQDNVSYDGKGTIFTVDNNAALAQFYIAIEAGTTANNLVFKPQLFDLTQMFGAGNEPATPAEFWSYFDHKVYPYNEGETQPLFKISRKSRWVN